MDIWPNFFIAGAARAGHTSMYNYLGKIKGIYMSPNKAPHYFLPVEKRKMTTEQYLSLFSGVKNEKAIGEATAAYLTNPESPYLIHQKLPHAKIIIILRDPIERTYSHYLQALRGHYVSESFDVALHRCLDLKQNAKFYNSFILPSFYHDGVKRFLDFFGSRQVKLIIFEEYVSDVRKTIEDILKFLEVESSLPDNMDEQYNAYSEPLGEFGMSIVQNKPLKQIARTILPRSTGIKILRTILNKKDEKPVLKEKEREQLRSIFEEDVEKLSKLLGYSLPWKNF